MAIIPEGKVSQVRLRELVELGVGTFFIPHDTWPQVLCVVTGFKPGKGRCHPGMTYHTVTPQVCWGLSAEGKAKSDHHMTLSTEEMMNLSAEERRLEAVPHTTGYGDEYKLMDYRLDNVVVWVIHDLNWYLDFQQAKIGQALKKIEENKQLSAQS